MANSDQDMASIDRDMASIDRDMDGQTEWVGRGLDGPGLVPRRSGLRPVLGHLSESIRRAAAGPGSGTESRAILDRPSGQTVFTLRLPLYYRYLFEVDCLVHYYVTALFAADVSNPSQAAPLHPRPHRKGAASQGRL